ncbi:hypothetical protein D3C71_1554350 [compost metagenome]
MQLGAQGHFRGVDLELLENHQYVLALRDFILVGMGDQIDQGAPFIAFDRHPAGLDRSTALLDLEQGGADFQTQLRKNQVQQVARQFAAHMPQETPGALAHVQDVGVGIDEYARWRRLFEGALVQVGHRQFALHAGFLGLPGHIGTYVAATGHGGRASAGGRAGFGAEDPVAFVDRGKQFMAGIGAFGRAEEQEAAGAQGEVEHLEDLALHFAIQIDQQIAANDQVDLRKRRVGQQAVLGE